jgi:endogenous inhibitor of DNA gyrase (YacG/DUF329 family)
MTPTPQNSLKCPICGEDAVERYRPFCSRRCADIDLGKWFSGTYSIAGRPEDDEHEASNNHGREKENGDHEDE